MKLERIQNYAMRLITSAKPRTPSAQLRSELSWMSLQDRREMQVVMKVHSCLHGRAPAYLCSKFSRNLNTEYRKTRGANNIQLQCPCTNFYRKSFEFNGAYLYGTNFPVLSNQSKPEKRLSRLFGSLSLNLNNCLLVFIVFIVL